MKQAIKLLLILTLVLLATSTSVYAACSTKTLRNVCNICEERALSNLDTDSVCPKTICPEVSCPSISKACVRTDSFQHLLLPNYTLTAMLLSQDTNDLTYKLSISKDANISGIFNYDVRYLNFRTALENSVGFILYDVVNFNLPITQKDKVLSYNCIGGIDNISNINGICSTIAPNEAGNAQLYNFKFTAIPASNPLQ